MRYSCPLRVVGRADQIGTQNLFAPWPVTGIIRALQGDKHRIDRRQNIGIGYREHPTSLSLVVIVENAQFPGLL